MRQSERDSGRARMQAESARCAKYRELERPTEKLTVNAKLDKSKWL